MKLHSYLFLLFCGLMPFGWAASSAEIERGKNYFFAYCAGCHSLKYQAAEVLTVSHPAPLPWQRYLDAGQWETLLSPTDAEAWFGRQPPDLSLVTIQYSKAWVKNYLLSFYDDPKHPWGRNNYLLKQVMMPDVLYANPQREKIAHDLACFLDDIAEPERHTRLLMGTLTLVITILALGLARKLKQVYKL